MQRLPETVHRRDWQKVLSKRGAPENTAQLEGKKFTRALKKVYTSEVNQSALTNHNIAETNHTIHWSGVKLTSKDPECTQRL